MLHGDSCPVSHCISITPDFRQALFHSLYASYYRYPVRYAIYQYYNRTADGVNRQLPGVESTLATRGLPYLVVLRDPRLTSRHFLLLANHLHLCRCQEHNTTLPSCRYGPASALHPPYGAPHLNYSRTLPKEDDLTCIFPTT